MEQISKPGHSHDENGCEWNVGELCEYNWKGLWRPGILQQISIKGTPKVRVADDVLELDSVSGVWLEQYQIRRRKSTVITNLSLSDKLEALSLREVDASQVWVRHWFVT